MKKLILAITILTTMSSFASDAIIGKIQLKGKVFDVAIDTNINTAKVIVLNRVQYQINRINETNIGATKGNVELEVFHGEAMNQILKMNQTQLAQSLGIQNAQEVSCTNASKGFLTITTANSILGNCVQ